MKRLFMSMKQVWTIEKTTLMAGMKKDNGFMRWSQDGGKVELIWLRPCVTSDWWLPLQSKVPATGLCLRFGWKESLIPLLKPGQVVVIDNATFHKGGRIEQLIQQAGCKLLYLPPYSPDLNKIERCWSWLTHSHSQATWPMWVSTGCDGAYFTSSVLTAMALAILLEIDWLPTKFRCR